MLRLEGVSKRFADTVALHPTTLLVAPGATTVLIGPSGCGKSTLLRLVVGLIAPDSGSVVFNDQPVNAGTVVAIRRHMGFVLQDGGLFPHLSARDNVIIMARHIAWSASRIQRRLIELCELTKLTPEQLDRFPAQLSGGQRQRVSLMRALMLDPDVLLLDEPLGALDPIIRSELQEDLAGIFKSLGKSVVFVTHDMGEAAYLGDTIVLMREGRIVQSGRLQDLVESPADPFVTRFINAQRSGLHTLPEPA